eukprot:jgi/Tetstr1/445576/TSEL_033348.t1
MGEYALASGPTAVRRAMSEVASMYLQGRLPGWINQLFASARLVAPVKKLGESGAPDIGVGISAGNSMLIHGDRLIAEKLRPRSAVIVHTDYLRNAYNEAWRRTIIQSHIDCSPLHPVIRAPSLPLHGFVSGRGRSVRYSASTMRLAGSFRTSIKASVGLEEHFDKMHAYSADMETARPEAATLTEDAVARARISTLHLPTRMNGAGIRRMATVSDAAFIGCTNDILPSYAVAMREAWGRLQAATAGHLSDADARVMERETEAVSGSQKELTAFLD